MKTLARLVLIEWKDSRQPTSAWQRIGEIGKLEYCDCVSVGWLIQDDADVKVLAANFADLNEDMQASGVITIPADAVHAIKPLAESTSSYHRKVATSESKRKRRPF